MTAYDESFKRGGWEYDEEVAGWVLPRDGGIYVMRPVGLSLEGGIEGWKKYARAALEDAAPYPEGFTHG